MAFPPLTDDGRAFLRNVAWLLLAFAAAMLVLDAFIRYAGMLWMDVPLTLIGAWLLLWSYKADTRAPAPPRRQV